MVNVVEGQGPIAGRKLRKRLKEIIIKDNPPKCKKCKGPLTGRQVKYCGKVKCQEAKLEARRERSRRQQASVRAASLEKNPRFCDYCGKAYTILDNLKIPVCHRKACTDWWSGEKFKRKKRLQEKYRKEKRYVGRNHGTKAESAVASPIGSWNHASFVAEQRKASKPNGRKCVVCRKGLKGDEKFRCKACLHIADDWEG